MQDYALAQSSVLGSMLIDARCIPEVLSHLHPEDINEGLSRNIFVAIRDLFLDGETVDPVTVLNKLGEATKERRRYVMALMEVTPTAHNVGEYINIVREESKARQLRELGAALSECHRLEDAQELMGRANDLLADRHGVQSVSMMEALKRFYDRQDTKQEYLTWGLDFLDEGLYVSPGNMIVLGGRPSDGKTAFALSTAYHQAKSQRVGFFSLETDDDTLFDRLFSSVAKVDSKRIKRRELTEADSDALARRVSEIKARDLHLVEAAGMTVRDIQAYALARKFDIIYVDYLQLIRASGRMSRYDQVTEISQDLHRMAQKHKITVVALSQLSRAEKMKDGTVRSPTLSDLRESGQIEQDADVVLFIYREKPNELRSPRNLRVAKNKEGETGGLPLLFDGATQSFYPDYARMRQMQEQAEAEEPQEEVCEQVQFREVKDNGDMPF